MNITPHTASLPLATVVNPSTEGLRRENHQREIITQVVATNPSAAEKGVASDKERARTPAQVNEQVDFANLRKQAEQAASTIAEQEKQQGGQQGEQESQHNAEHQQDEKTENANTTSSETEQDNEIIQQEQIDEKIINQLQQRDKEVRTHELAHATAGGSATGSPSFTFEVGPDGKKYAVGGEVAVDLSSVAGDPQATITKMQKIHAAALAPASPSTQDTRVAASAAQTILAAQSELLALKSDAATQSSNANNNLNIQSNSTLNKNQNDESNDFDTLINQTLTAQDAILSSSSNHQLASTQSINSEQSNDVQQRALRVESYYFKISQGYEKPDNFQFELTA
ncbi:putative metalloprotease CJM1_0395 family protein [Colwellia psychrerythraea]|uniref:SprA-related family n=1 Tax=Colwellia psychrerythraea TaxID=28229 RepID=A0A099L3M5_COLPS|nr:putative metalloprotease CJM1_0395 family protein [Colwellia psychrerythraea]KGJ97466.1 SprA-related family [Colwellia psychrerythraea]